MSRTDPDAKIAKMKDGTTHLAYKPEHAVDLDTGAVVAAEIHPADEGDTTTLSGTLQVAAANLAKVDRVPTTTATAELVADKGYHPKSGGWPVNLVVGLGLSSRFAGGIRRAKGSGAVRAAGL